MEIQSYLLQMAETGGSDLYFISGSKPQMKVHGQIVDASENILESGHTTSLCHSLLSVQQQKEFNEHLELNLMYSIPKVGRFRVNVYRESGEIALVIRHIPIAIPSIESLKLPKTIKSMVMEKHGLVLIAGPTGSGKSTTLAAMLNYRNQNQSGHILSIEDPIEFIHAPQKSLFSQREIGRDTHSFEDALKNALREAPDIIMLGEIRDLETMQYAINYAQTGHLCLASIHANNVQHTIERVLNFFPDESRQKLLYDLGSTLKGIISQRLIPNLTGQLHACAEVLLQNPSITELIQKGDLAQIRYKLEEHFSEGMRSFNQSLLHLFKTGVITDEEALLQSDAKTDLNLQIRMGGNDPKENSGGNFTTNSEI